LENSPFKIMVYAIVFIAILALIYLLFFFPQKEPGVLLEEGLEVAQGTPGKYFSMLIDYPQDFFVLSKRFDSLYRFVRFECNSVQDCTPDIVSASTDSLAINQRNKILTSFRCIREQTITNCTIYLGEEPAQINIMDFHSKEEIFDISQGMPRFVISFSNKGKQDSQEFTIFTETFIEQMVQGSLVRKKYFEQEYSDFFELKAGEERDVEFELDLIDSGKYFVRVTAKGSTVGSDSKTISFEVIVPPLSSECKAILIDGEPFMRGDECIKKCTCSGCRFGFECKNECQKTFGGIFEISDPTWAKKVLDTSECDLKENGGGGEDPVNGGEPTDPSQKTQDSFCRDYTMTTENSPFKKCDKYRPQLERYRVKNGLAEQGIDLLFIESLIMQESSCDNDISNGQGLMQVVKCAVNRQSICSLEENIDAGTEELLRNFLNTKKQVSSFNDAITLTLFGYNRGEATRNLAIKYINEGMDLKQAMEVSCLFYYDQGAYGGCGGFDREACCGMPGTHNGVPHSGKGLGARYPEVILERYYAACSSVGGKIR
jgi:hypothetical protein